MGDKNTSVKSKKLKGWELLLAIAICIIVIVIFFSGFSGINLGSKPDYVSSESFESYKKNLEHKVKNSVSLSHS